MVEENSNFEIVLPDGTMYKPEKDDRQKRQSIQGYDPEGKPKKMIFSIKTGCDRCGECCRRDTPIILKEDIPLLTKGIISEKDIYTIREGEKMRSSIDGDTYYSSMEIIKIRPIFGSFTCLFYDPVEGCTIYEQRPTVCRQYECWSQNIAITGLEGRRLTRAHLFGGIDFIKETIKKHEEYCSLTKFQDLIDELKKGKEENVEKIAEMILYDSSLRDWIKEKLELSDDILPLLFGKTLLELATFYGLIIEKEGENFLIKVIQEEET
ncbi:MAG: YkgJ family cysteine cluster protein [Thermodesulfovibrio sp.]|nr:YkgJ family cysteine cluster protein [Thermodesulfovibrio sp.]